MYRKQNMLLAATLTGWITLMAILYLSAARRGYSPVEEDMYQLKNSAEIDEVRMRSKGGKVVLRYDGTRWRVNEKYAADGRLVTVLFATLKAVRPKRPVAARRADSARRRLAADGTLVSLWAKGKKQKEFYAGGNASKTIAYFQEGNNEPHIMAIPGYRVYASGIFEVDEWGWRNKRIFDFDWRRFSTLSSAFPGQPDKGFTVKKTSQGFGVAELTRTDTARLNSYLDAVSLLAATRLIPAGRSAQYDSLALATPQVRIAVTDVEGNEYALDLYPPLPNDRNVLGQKDDRTLVLFARKAAAPIFMSREHFVPQR